MVRGLPLLIWSINSGITDPQEAITLPYLVPQNIVFESSKFLDFATITFSIIALDMPMALIGYAALSVLSTTTFFTLCLSANVNTLSVPRMLVFTASNGKNSQEGTCFNAAA